MVSTNVGFWPNRFPKRRGRERNTPDSADIQDCLSASAANRPVVCNNELLDAICLQKQVGGRLSQCQGMLSQGLLDAEDVDDEHEGVATLDLIAGACVAVSEVARDDDDDPRADLLTN